MSSTPAITPQAPVVGALEGAAAPGRRRRRLLFWVRRYLPAEIAGTAAMIAAGMLVTLWTTAPIAIALAALLGESLGFYLVLAVTIYGEQAAQTRNGPHGRRRAATRTVLLLLAEFGPAELLDSLLIRPAALFLGVLVLPDAVWGLLAGKILADLVFYAMAAGAFTFTDRAGLRVVRPQAEVAP
jgi:hypothetical protein